MAVKDSKGSEESDAMAALVVDELAPLGSVTSRKMFGGYGVFSEGTMFAMVDPSACVLFRVTEATRPQYEAAGSVKHSRMPYWTVPEGVLDDHDRLLALGREALSVALAAKVMKK